MRRHLETVHEEEVEEAGTKERQQPQCWASQLNRQRAGNDTVFLLYCLFCVAACYRFYPHAGAEEAIILCLFTAVVLAVLAWSDLHPDRYSWWRELVVPAVRVGRWLPVPTGSRALFKHHALLWLMGAQPLARFGPGLLGHTLFLAQLLLGSGALLLLIGALASPLRLPVQAVTLALELAITLPRTAELCSCAAMRHPAAAGLVRLAHEAATLLLSPLSAGSTLPGSTGGGAGSSKELEPEEAHRECLAVVAMLQLALGALLPLAVHAVREAAAHRSFHAAQRQHHQQQPQHRGGGSGVLQKAAGWLYGGELQDGWLQWAVRGAAVYIMLCPAWGAVTAAAAWHS